jgi:hypothetical protein
LPALGNTDGFLVYFSASGLPLSALPLSSAGTDSLETVLPNPAAPGCVAGGTLNDVAIVFVTDVSGNQLWQTTMPSSGSSTVMALTRSADGRLFAAGQFSGTMTIAGTTLIGHDPQPDVFVVELDAASGTPLSARSFGGAGTEQVYRITATPDGALVMLGEFTGDTSFDGTQATSLGQADVFLHRIIP